MTLFSSVKEQMTLSHSKIKHSHGYTHVKYGKNNAMPGYICLVIVVL